MQSVVEGITALHPEMQASALASEICVIGSGPGGGFAAAALADAGHDVLILEAGHESPCSAEISAFDDFDTPGNVDLRFGRAIQLGGSSNLWAGRVTPLQSIDFEARPWVPGSGWPLSAADLAPYFARVRQIMGMQSPAEPVLPEGYPNGLTSGELEAKLSVWSRPAFNIADHLRARVSGGRLRVVLGAQVRELKETERGNSIASATVISPGGGTLEARAQRFVLAAGGIETPRILLNSRTRQPSGLGNARDQVGRYFSTHPKADMATLLLDRPVSLSHPLFMDCDLGGNWVRAGIGFSGAAQRTLRLLNHYVQLSPIMEHQAIRLFEKLRASSAITSPLIDRNAALRGSLLTAGRIVFDAIGKLSGLQRRARVFVLRAFLDQYPDPDNRVTLSPELDANGLPKPKIIWNFSAQDRASTLEFFKHLDRIVRVAGLGRVEYSKLQQLEEWPITAIHSHFMGTTRMGTDTGCSVVDGSCRVHGCDNLFVAGPSLFTAYGYANPFLTIGALSLRLADRLHALANPLR